jgi:hypothetical protein
MPWLVKKAWLGRAVSVLGSTEDARLLALRSVRAAITVAARGLESPPQLGTAVVQGVVATLLHTLQPTLAQAGKGAEHSHPIAFSWLGSSLASLAEVAQARLSQEWHT